MDICFVRKIGQLYEAVASSKRMTKTRLLIEVFDEVAAHNMLLVIVGA